MQLIIDIGNTIAKVALFEGDSLVRVGTLPNSTLSGLEGFCADNPIHGGIVSSVIDPGPGAKDRLRHYPLLYLRGDTPLPITNLYRTPRTLGYDRIAAAVGAYTTHKGKDIMVIDMGTCITFDLVDSQGRYHGGNISPGVSMRLTALHEHTSRLPLVDARVTDTDLGNDTTSAILAGVWKGIEYEITGYIHMMNRYPDPMVILTGGDYPSVIHKLQGNVTAEPYLTLRGLNAILLYNTAK